MTGSRNCPRLIAVLGPTAAGKTALSLALQAQLDTDIISMDSALVYRRMNIGTAKPEADILAAIPHQLIDVREPWESYTASNFASDALSLIEDNHAQGRPSLLAGGTMLYLQALLQGLSPLPEADADVRAELEAEAATVGWPALHVRLRGIDPVAADRISPNDSQRIQRALEVHTITGRSLSALQGDRIAPSLEVMKIILAPPDRSVLHRRIEQRFSAMLAAGLIEEVRALLDEPQIHPALGAMRSVGYRQVCQYLDGEFDRSECEQRGIYATRQLAKRQLTWLRKETDALWLDPAEHDLTQQVSARVAAFVEQG